MTRRLVVFLAALTLLAACGPTPSHMGSERERDPRSTPRNLYSGNETGPAAVGSIPDSTLHDNERNRDLVVTIDYPTRGEGHPLIVFSPSFGGASRSYVGLSSYWASNGYVVIRLGHPDQGKPEDQTAADWKNRVRDVSFVLDSLDRLAERYPELKGKIDPARVGVAGHAYGAHTASLAAGVRTFPGGVSYADPRIKAVAVLSQQGPAERLGLTPESFASLTVPALFITGTRDQGMTEAETPEWRKEAFALAPAGDKWLVVIDGARQASFTGRMDDLIEAVAQDKARVDPLNPNNAPTNTPVQSAAPTRTRAEMAMMRQQEAFAIARGTALAFFDAYLKGDAKGREALEKAGSRGGVKLERK